MLYRPSLSEETLQVDIQLVLVDGGGPCDGHCPGTWGDTEEIHEHAGDGLAWLQIQRYAQPGQDRGVRSSHRLDWPPLWMRRDRAWRVFVK